MRDYYKGKGILVTGLAGTVGKELVRQLVEMGPENLRLADNNECENSFSWSTDACPLCAVCRMPYAI